MSSLYRRRSYLERYERGDCETVWLELTALGSIIRDEPLYSEALAVAQETVRRIRHNVEVLYQRLTELDYRFACQFEEYPYHPFELADAQDHRNVRTAEHTFGVLPVSLRVLYESLSSIDFRGHHPKLSFHADAPHQYPDTIPRSDPLFLAPLYPLEGTVEGVYRDDMSPIRVFASLDIMPDIPMKAGESGSSPSSIIFPNVAMDTHLLAGDWPGLLFMSYLRLSFRWGGFPGFMYLPEAAEAAKAELQFLKKDLLPI